MEAEWRDAGNGQWTFNGAPIQIKIVTRVEDERRDIGDLVRAALEGVGFQVQPIYQQFGPATLAVYASDPMTFQWHIYTEGWGRGAPVRYDDAGINQFAAPWLGNMPGWQEVGFWQYENEALDEIGKRLYRGEFASQEERDNLYQDMTEVALDESVRVWLVTALQSFPVRTEIENLTEDLVGGPRNIFALRGAEIPGKDTIRVGHLWVWTERTTWNPVGGFGDVYSSDIYRNMVDPPLVNHPFTGLPLPFRADYEVETAGPDGTLRVPEGAVMWDPVQDAGRRLASGTTAKSKVTFDYAKYLQATWHHGPPITMADVIYPIAQGYEIAYDEAKVQIETALGITSRPLSRRSRAMSSENDRGGLCRLLALRRGLHRLVCLTFRRVDALGIAGGDGRRGLRQAAGRVFGYRRRPVQRALDQPGDRERCPPGAALDPAVQPRKQCPGRRTSTSAARRWSLRRAAEARYEACDAWFECDQPAGAGQWAVPADALRSTRPVRPARRVPARGVSLHGRGFPVRHAPDI